MRKSEKTIFKTGHYFTYYLLFYMSLSVYTTYISIYLQSVGFSTIQIGKILAIAPVMNIPGQYIYGRIADFTGNIPILLAFLFSLTSFILAFYKLGTSYGYLLFITAIYSLVSCSFLQLSDAHTLEYCAATNSSYSTIRLGGTIGYALMAGVSGFALSGSIENMFFLSVIINVTSAFLVFTLPRNRGKDYKSIRITKDRNSYLSLFKDIKLDAVLLLNFFVYIPLSFYNVFFPIYINNLNVLEGNTSILGITVLLAVLCEIPFLLFAVRIVKRIGLEKLMVLSCFIMAIRWLGLSLFSSPILIVIINCLNGGSSIVLTYCSVNFINQHVHSGLRASGQTLLGVIVYGFSRILGSFLGGLLARTIGIAKLFGVGSLIVLLSTILYIYAIYTFNRIENKKGDL